MLKVLYFAGLRESFGSAGESLPVPSPATVAELINVLRARGDRWADSLAAGKRWRVAVNQDMATLESPLKAGDEVAIFPPVTGG